MTDQNERPTISDVAEMAGCSVATVSRVLNGKGPITPEGQSRVDHAVKELGYVPIRKRKWRKSPRPKSPLKHGSVTLLWSASRNLMQTLTGQNLLQGLTDGLRSEGFTLNIEYLESDGSIPVSLQSGKGDGFVLHGNPPEADVTPLLKNFPVVWLFASGPHGFGDRVQPDHVSIGEISAEHFHQLGFEKVCCISTNLPEFPYIADRKAGFLSRCAALGLSVELIENELTPELANEHIQGLKALRLAAKLAKDFACLSPRPEAIFVANWLGPFLHIELTKLGIVPMKDVCMIAGDTSICSQHPLDPEPVTIRIFSREIGLLGALRMRERIQHPHLPEVVSLVKPRLHFPESYNGKLIVSGVTS